jgi:hypothetical protein
MARQTLRDEQRLARANRMRGWQCRINTERGQRAAGDGWLASLAT